MDMACIQLILRKYHCTRNNIQFFAGKECLGMECARKKNNENRILSLIDVHGDTID
jgi:hypothetical protein